MKNYKLIYIISSVLVLLGAAMRILHIEYGIHVFIIGLLFGSFAQGFIIKKQEQRIKELENQQ